MGEGDVRVWQEQAGVKAAAHAKQNAPVRWCTHVAAKTRGPDSAAGGSAAALQSSDSTLCSIAPNSTHAAQL